MAYRLGTAHSLFSSPKLPSGMPIKMTQQPLPYKALEGPQ